MGRLSIARAHGLGWLDARALAQAWVAAGEARWGLQCQRFLGDGHERIDFQGPGLQGCLWVRPQRFELELELGFLLNAYRSRIEAEIRHQLDLAVGGDAPSGRD